MSYMTERRSNWHEPLLVFYRGTRRPDTQVCLMKSLLLLKKCFGC